MRTPGIKTGCLASSMEFYLVFNKLGCHGQYPLRALIPLIRLVDLAGGHLDCRGPSPALTSPNRLYLHAYSQWTCP
jgi:hypothetical protein